MSLAKCMASANKGKLSLSFMPCLVRWCVSQQSQQGGLSRVSMVLLSTCPVAAEGQAPCTGRAAWCAVSDSCQPPGALSVIVSAPWCAVSDRVSPLVCCQ